MSGVLARHDQHAGRFLDGRLGEFVGHALAAGGAVSDHGNVLDLDAVGAKLYTAIHGKFTFVVALFSACDDARTLAIFGAGVQARAHLPALPAVRPFKEALVAGIDGARVKAGAFVAAIGSSKPDTPDTREIDTALVRRAARIVEEWRPQAPAEAGDLLLCGPCLDWAQVAELADAIAREHPLRRNPDEILLYKAIGVGLEDVALAEWIHRRQAYSPR